MGVAEGVTAGVAALALAVSVAAYVDTHHASETADRSYDLAFGTAQAEVAKNIFLGEIPQKYEPPIAFGVTNAGPVDVTRVWVAGAATAGGPLEVVIIGTVQPCTVYTVNGPYGDGRPSGEFRATTLHFFDGSQYWTRTSEGTLAVDKSPQIPMTATRRDSPRTLDAAVCGR